MFKIAERVAVLERGRVLVTGTSEELVGDERVIEAYLGGRPAVVSTAR